MRKSSSGRPSLIGTMARTAVIAGTATAVSNSVSNSQQQKAQQKAAAQQAQATAQQAQIDAAAQQAVAQHVAAQQATAPAAPAAASADPAPAAAAADNPMIAQLKKLGELHQAGILSDEEFAAAKAKVLAGRSTFTVDLLEAARADLDCAQAPFRRQRHHHHDKTLARPCRRE